jgi:hypothetical protein
MTEMRHATGLPMGDAPLHSVGACTTTVINLIDTQSIQILLALSRRCRKLLILAEFL